MKIKSEFLLDSLGNTSINGVVKHSFDGGTKFLYLCYIINLWQFRYWMEKKSVEKDTEDNKPKLKYFMF